MSKDICELLDFTTERAKANGAVGVAAVTHFARVEIQRAEKNI